MRFPHVPTVLGSVFGAALGATLILGTVACDGAGGSKKKAAPVGDPIAVIAGVPLTVEQLQKKLDEQSPFVRARYAEPGKKKEFLDGQVRFEVLAAEARARGYEEDPEVEEAVKKIIVQRLTREEFDGRVQLKDVTDAELKTYFDAHRTDYQKPEMARASIVTIAFGEGKLTKDKAKAAAEDVAKQAAAKADDRVVFKNLVEKFSTDAATKAAGGDIRYLDRAEVEGRLGKPVADWLFGAEDINAVSPVFELQDGSAFVVVKRTGRRKAIERDFEQVKNQIKNVVYREKRSAEFNVFVEQLKTKHAVKIYEDKVEKLKVDAAAAAAATMDPHDAHGHGGAPMPSPGAPGVPGPTGAGGDDVSE
jgi:peptidyl-prolyl cis-trans isomerase C